jgi:hypothetical protein
MDRLSRLGIESWAIDLPLTGYADDVACVRAAVEAAGAHGKAVHLVCHSYSGLPVAAGGHGAAHLTFVAARLPRRGESPAGHTPAWGSPEYQRCAQMDGDGVVRLSPDARDLLFHRTSAPLADFAMGRLRPMTSLVPVEPVPDPAWTSVPSSYVVCADDRVVRPGAQRERAALVAASVELDADHSPFFSRPAELADFIADRYPARVAT